MNDTTVTVDKSEYLTTLKISGINVRTWGNSNVPDKIEVEVIKTFAHGGIINLNGNVITFGRVPKKYDNQPHIQNITGVMDNRHRNWRTRNRSGQ